MCFAAAVHISQHLKQSVVFVDTTGGLTAGRLLQMLEAESSTREEQVRMFFWNLQPCITPVFRVCVCALVSAQMEALQRIHVFRLFDVFSLLDCLYALRAGTLQQVGVCRGGRGG